MVNSRRLLAARAGLSVAALIAVLGVVPAARAAAPADAGADGAAAALPDAGTNGTAAAGRTSADPAGRSLAACADPPAIVGFASVDAWGQAGTTGGCGGPMVTVSTADAFLAAIAQSGPLTIQVQGMISLPGPMHDVTSDKTIVGVGAASGLSGGGLNVGLPIDDDVIAPPADAVRNVIIRNLVFRGAPDDAINVQMFTHHVWIDHNDLAEGFDGLIDIKRGASYVTVSWNHTHDHDKNMLLGHDNSNGPQDAGQLKVTYHHNWFDGTPQRNPRVRFGEPVHIFNNYFVVNAYVGVACQCDSGCMVEGNYFHEVKRPVKWDYNGPEGRAISRDNVYTYTGTGDFEPPVDKGPVEEPDLYYPYALDPAADIPAIVTAGAGTGKI